MSQAGIIDVIGSNPQIPTMFTANIGTAIPLLNNINIFGTGGITTTAAGDTITISGTGVFAETLTGNTGGAVGPTGSNINTVGTGSITISGNPGTSSGGL